MYAKCMEYVRLFPDVFEKQVIKRPISSVLYVTFRIKEGQMNKVTDYHGAYMNGILFRCNPANEPTLVCYPMPILYNINTKDDANSFIDDAVNSMYDSFEYRVFLSVMKPFDPRKVSYTFIDEIGNLLMWHPYDDKITAFNTKDATRIIGAWKANKHTYAFLNDEPIAITSPSFRQGFMPLESFVDHTTMYLNDFNTSPTPRYENLEQHILNACSGSGPGAGEVTYCYMSVNLSSMPYTVKAVNSLYKTVPFSKFSRNFFFRVDSYAGTEKYAPAAYLESAIISAIEDVIIESKFHDAYPNIRDAIYKCAKKSIDRYRSLNVDPRLLDKISLKSEILELYHSM